MGPVARRYAKAIFELASEQGDVDAATRELHTVAGAFEASPELGTVLSDPTVAPEARKAIMTAVLERLGVSQMVRHAVLLVTDHGRAAFLPQIAARLTDLADEKAGKVRAEVTSATPLSDEQYVRLTSTLERLTGRRIALSRKVDPTLIGGVVTRIGDKVFDGSVRTRIAEMRQSLLPS